MSSPTVAPPSEAIKGAELNSVSVGELDANRELLSSDGWTGGELGGVPIK